jgi:hypothetical protein
MTLVHQTLASVLWLLPVFALGYFALMHFFDGLAMDAAIPVPVYMIAQIAMPKIAYEDAAIALGRADGRDGEAQIARAEAGLRGGALRPSTVSELIQGLVQEPASARGWMLLSEAWPLADKSRAARALSLALLLAPNEYWLAGSRAHDAARLWLSLDADAQKHALDQTQLLWREPPLRGQLRALLASPAGVALVSRAFVHDPSELRAMNRWLARARHDTAFGS